MVTKVKDAAFTVLKVALEYIVWMVFTVSQMGLMLWIHQLIVSYSFILGREVKNAWLPRAVDQWSIALLGIPVLVVIFVTQSYLNKGMRLQRFWRYVAILAAIEGAIALVLYAIDFFWL